MKTDVIIIGSGQAGVPLSTKLAAAGKHVLLVERGLLGGTCTNTGCTPTKTLIASARAAHVARRASRLGIQVKDVRVDFPAVIARKDSIVRQWRDGIDRKLRQAGDSVTLLEGHARFVGEREIEVNGHRHQAATVIINVGARPAVPPIPGLESAPWVDNRRAMELRELPEHLLIIGGGYVGCEFAQMFRRFGSRVTLIDRGAHLLSNQDDDISPEIERVFRDENIALELDARVRMVSRADSGAVAVTLEGGKELRGSHLLVATGRRPNTDDLACDAGGIQLDPRGFIVVDDFFRTSVPGVYAVGDVTGEPQFTHVSWDDHRILADFLLGRSRRGRAGRNFPYAVFTDPQVAGVGLTERAARAKGIAYEVATMPFREVARAIEVDETAGLLKVLIDPKSDGILGAFIVGADAGELIHVFVTLMQVNAPPRAIVDAQFIHPTFSEGIQAVVMKLE